MTPHPLPAFLRAAAPVVVAHRGGGGLFPENTLPAFENAVALGVDAVEMDVHRTRDGAIVVAHDETVERVSDGEGRIRDHTLASLRRLDAAYSFSPDGGRTFPLRGRGVFFPLLEEVVAAVPRLGLSIEIKPDDLATAETVARLVLDLGLESRTCLGTFDHATAAYLRRRAPGIATAASRCEVRRYVRLALFGLGWLCRDGAAAYAVPEKAGRWRVLTPRRVRQLQRRGRPVHVWTVNEEADMRRLLAWGVDGIITDRPDRLLAVLGRPGRSPPDRP